MLNLKFKPKSIRKKVSKTLKKSMPTAQKARIFAARLELPDVLLTAVCPEVAKTFVKRDQQLKQREAALELKTNELRNEKAMFEAAKVAESEKQARIKQGATTMFRENRFYSQRELFKQQRAAEALETALCQAAQQEIDTMSLQRDQSIAALLVSAAMHMTATEEALQSKAKAHEIGDLLAQAIAASQSERLLLQRLASGVDARAKELGSLVSSAKTQQAKAHGFLLTAIDQCARFMELTHGVEMRTRELDALLADAKDDRAEAHQQSLTAKALAVRFGIAVRAIELTEKLVEQEGAKILQDARIETQRRMTALADARADFERLRAAEKSNLANRHAHMDCLRDDAEKEKNEAKRERESVRLLGIKAEIERAASVDAKREALGELERAFRIRDESRQASLAAKQEAMEDLKAAEIMRDESKWAIDRLFVIAGGMARTTSGSIRSTSVTTDMPESTRIARDQDDDRDGRISRMEIYRDKRLSGTPGPTRHGDSNLKNRTNTLGIAERDSGELALNPIHQNRMRGPSSPHYGKDTRRPVYKSLWKQSVIADENTPQSIHSPGARASFGLKSQEHGSKGPTEVEIQNSRDLGGQELDKESHIRRDRTTLENVRDNGV